MEADESKADEAKPKKEVGPPLALAEAESKALEMLEFYFGDSNYSWDRFMQTKV